MEKENLLDEELPRYSELPPDASRPSGSAWGVFGEGDGRGAIGYQLTEQRVLDAAHLVRRGATFSLNLSLDEPSPPILGRRATKHHVTQGPTGLDDFYDDFYPQAGSQWDALAHVRHPQLGFYNGATDIDVIEGRRLGIDEWATDGIAGRFVLIDLERHFRELGQPLDHASRFAVTAADLDAALDRQNTKVAEGSILLLHFGWLGWYLGADAKTKARLGVAGDFDDLSKDAKSFFACPGLAQDESTAEWLWDHRVAAVAADNPALEAQPFSRVTTEGHLHYRLVVLLGIGIGELWKLDDLAADCDRDRVYEGLLTSAPLNMPGGIGSPANAIAIK
jgi:kynurenine formamidase